MNKIWPMLLKSSWSMQKSKNIRQKENNTINEMCVSVCEREIDRDRERKDIEIKKAVWGKQIYISKNNSAERKCSNRGSVTMSVWGMGLSVPDRMFEKENEINTTSGKAKSLLYLSHQGKVGYLCGPECYEPRSSGWEIPKLASVAPRRCCPLP